MVGGGDTKHRDFPDHHVDQPYWRLASGQTGPHAHKHSSEILMAVFCLEEIGIEVCVKVTQCPQGCS